MKMRLKKVEVEWIDHVGYHEFIRIGHAKRFQLITNSSVGYVIDLNSERLVLASGYCPKDVEDANEEVFDVNVIATQMIVSMHELVRGKAIDVKSIT